MFGRNGIGKSTLLRVAAGLISPDSGVVHFRGRPRLRASLAAFAREGLFWLPDHDLYSHAFSVRSQLGFFASRFGGRPVEEAAELCGISTVLDQRPSALSGGELRRAELAAVFVRAPLCLLADEPLRGVSPADAEVIGRLFRTLAGRGAAVVVSGHEVSLLNLIADQVTWCTAGTTYELGSPAEAAQHAGFRTEYLGATV
jgi:ABC-type multidrug transport system ATPase subunit